jgi:hypothetical protein
MLKQDLNVWFDFPRGEGKKAVATKHDEKKKKISWETKAKQNKRQKERKTKRESIGIFLSHICQSSQTVFFTSNKNNLFLLREVGNFD